MPIGVDLGFPFVVLVVLLFSAIGFVIRWKWRLSAARREEIRRLLELAAEEAARAELEASASYVTSPSAVAPISSPVQYHKCAVCFSPAATRCSRCKAVRYCSGKCQIVHWRQGHKEDCLPFTASHQNNDTGAAPSQLLRRGNEIHGNGIENVERQYAGCIRSTPEESLFSKSDCHSEVFGRNNDSQVEHFFDGEGVDSSFHETERSDRKQSVNAMPVELKINHIKTTEVMEQARVIHPDKFDDMKSDHTRSSPSTSSSGAVAGDSNESSFSEPFTPSSGFWDKTIDFKRTKLEACDDSSQSSSSDAGDTDMPTSRASPKIFFSCSMNNIPPVDGQNSLSKVVISDGALSPNFGTRKPIHRTLSSEEKSDNASEGEGSPSLIHENSDEMGVDSRDGSPVSNDMEPQSCTPRTISCLNLSPKGRPVDVPSKSSEYLTSSPKRSNGMVGDTRSSLHPLQSEEGGSLKRGASVAHLSTTSTHSLQGSNSLKVGSANATGVSYYGSHNSDPRNGKSIVEQLKDSKSSTHHHTAIGSEIAGAGRYTDKGLFSYDMFVRLYNWNKVDLRPTGLTNCGNSCYANTVLQCLACTPPLTAYLLQGLHSKECKKKEWCFTCEFESLILKSKEGISPLSPIRILSQTQKLGNYLGNGREEDAHEFLRAAIDNMQSVCLKNAQVIAPSSFEEETTLIGLTFGGYLRSKIKCMRCGGKSERHERMMDLTVEIEGNIGTLEAALRKFTGTEILDDENKYKCSRCRSYEKAKKKLKVQEAPNVLTIALKRFQSGKFGKLNKSIQFPEILDLAPYMSGTSDKSPIYKLYGVVVHLDVMNATFSGHYVCYVKNLQNKWFKVDDSVVSAVEREDVLSKKAYMLFYARCSPRAPRSIRNSIIPLELRKPKYPLFKLRSCSTGLWDGPLNGQDGIECLYPSYSNFHHNRRILEDDYLSENSSSLFSEVRSCSTESSNKDSSSTDEFFDHVFGDTDQNWNNMWKHSSDSDSSSSSSSSSPSPPFGKRSPLSDSTSYSSGKPETNDQQVQRPNEDDNSFWVRKIPSLNSCAAKQSRKLDSKSSSSCRETDVGRLVWANAFGSDKSGLSFRKSTRERGD